MFKKIYSLLQQKILHLRSFGKGSIIKYPYKIWGPDCIKLGENVFIAESSFLSAVKNWNNMKFNPIIEIGDNVTIGSNFFITCIKKIKIEKNVLISDRVFISDHIHDYKNVKLPVVSQPLEFKGEVLIKEGSFIGINSVIMPGVTLGKNSIVGASSVVTKSVPDYTVVVGNPAKVITKYDRKEKKWRKV